MTNKNKKVRIILGLILTLTAIYIPFSAENSESNGVSAYPAPGFIAPEFELSDSLDRTLKLSEYQGKTVLVLFWASWCSVCKSIMPDLQSIYPELYLEGFEILAINTTDQDQKRNAIAYIEEEQITFPILFDYGGNVSNDYMVRALPTAFIITRQGLIYDQIIGNGLNNAYLLSQIEAISR